MIDLFIVLSPFLMGVIILIQFIGDALAQWADRSD